MTSLCADLSFQSQDIAFKCQVNKDKDNKSPPPQRHQLFFVRNVVSVPDPQLNQGCDIIISVYYIMLLGYCEDMLFIARIYNTRTQQIIIWRLPHDMQVKVTIG